MINFIYIIFVIILSAGFLMMILSKNYIKKIIGLSCFQNAILIFYIALGKKLNGGVPINICNKIADTATKCEINFSSPLPHVLMLTAIVVGFATLSVAMSFVIKINKISNSEENI